MVAAPSGTCIYSSARSPRTLASDGEEAASLSPGLEMLMATEPWSRVAEEQAALHRVAMLVARGSPPDQIYAAISDEAQGLFGSQAAVLRFERYGPAVVFVGV